MHDAAAADRRSREFTVAIAGMPPPHLDPLDRMLPAQSIVEAITLLTSDPMVAQYPAPVRRG